MKAEDFSELAKNRLESCETVLLRKGKEYERNGDRLHNFKAAARIKGETAESALLGMYVKHLVSVMDMIDDIERDIIPTKEVIADKFNDSINYHLLLEGLIEEHRSPVADKIAPLEGTIEYLQNPI